MAEKMGAIEKEVTKAFGIKSKDGEDFQTYIKRISHAIDNNDEDSTKWDSLSPAAQKFMNDVSIAIKKGNDVEPFPADEEEDEEEDDEAEAKPKGKKAAAKDDSENGGADGDKEEAEGEEEEEAEKPAKQKGSKDVTTKKKAVATAKDKGKPVKGDKGKPVKGEKTAKAKPAKKAKPEKAPKKKGKSATMRIKELVFGKPDITTEEVVAKLKKEGFSATQTTVASYRADFLHSMRYLKSAGVKGLPNLD